MADGEIKTSSLEKNYQIAETDIKLLKKKKATKQTKAITHTFFKWCSCLFEEHKADIQIHGRSFKTTEKRW